MSIASRTPGGDSFYCPICDRFSSLEPSAPLGDFPCPHCGHLVGWFRNRFDLGDDLQALSAPIGKEDSLDTVELVMELEEHFDVKFPTGQLSQFDTLLDLMRWLQQTRPGHTDD